MTSEPASAACREGFEAGVRHALAILELGAISGLPLSMTHWVVRTATDYQHAVDLMRAMVRVREEVEASYPASIALPPADAPAWAN